MAATWPNRWAVLAIAAVLFQLAVLYDPSPPGLPGPVGTDKLLHAAIFAAPAFCAVMAGLRWWLVGILLAAQAVVSELVQALALVERSGDPWDLVADLVGLAAGLLLGNTRRRRSARRRAVALTSARRSGR